MQRELHSRQGRNSTRLYWSCGTTEFFESVIGDGYHVVVSFIDNFVSICIAKNCCFRCPVTVRIEATVWQDYYTSPTAAGDLLVSLAWQVYSSAVFGLQILCSNWTYHLTLVFRWHYEISDTFVTTGCCRETPQLTDSTDPVHRPPQILHTWTGVSCSQSEVD